MELNAQKREILGKKLKSLRNQGVIPAELYGRDFGNVHLMVPTRDFLNVFKEAGESSIVKLRIGNEKKDLNVLIHDVSKNPLTDEILHVDFYQVRMDEKITTEVPLRFSGESPAVKEKNGVLVKAVQEIEIEALPGDLPQYIDVDLSRLSDIGMNIQIKDLKVGPGIKILIDPETVVATVAEQAKEEVAEKPVSVEDVKVEGAEKKEQKAPEGEMEVEAKAQKKEEPRKQ